MFIIDQKVTQSDAVSQRSGVSLSLKQMVNEPLFGGGRMSQ